MSVLFTRPVRTYRFPRWRRRNWRRARKPIGLHELTPKILALIQRDADISMLPQTVWPSRLLGVNFVAVECLVVAMAMPADGQRPADAAPGTQPLLTILPRNYYTRYEWT